MDQQISLSVYGIVNPSPLLRKMLEENPSNEADWLRAAMRITNHNESLYCLGSALSINPRSRTAQWALEAFEQADAPASTSVFARIRTFFSRGRANTKTSVGKIARAETLARI